MPIQGARIVPRLDISVGTSSASLVIRKPDGATVDGTGETGSSGNTVWTADEVELTLPGVWLFHWDTDDGDAEQYVIVTPAGAGLQLPPSLTTIAHLVATLGRPLTAEQLARAPATLASASVKIRGYTKRTFAATEGDQVVLRPVGSTLRLPQTPVVTVAQVEQIGTAGTADRVVPVGDWAFDGIDKIDLLPWPVDFAPAGTYADTYRVTYDHTLAVPEFIADMCADVTLRTLTAPTQAAGLVSERIGQYSYQYGQFPGGQSPGTEAKLSKEDKQALREAGFRRSASTIQTRAG